MRRRFTTLRELLALLIVATFVAGVVVIAIRADARSSVRTQTNDGGAWLVNGEYGVIGQVNRASMEVSGVVDVADSGEVFDVEQRGQLVVVNNEAKGELNLVDPRTYNISNTMKVAEEIELTVVDGGAVVWTPTPLRVWYLSEAQLGGLESLDELEPLVTADGDGLVTVSRNDQVIVVDKENDRLGRFDAANGDGVEPEVQFHTLSEKAEGLTGLSAIGDDALLMDESSISLLPATATDEESIAAAFGLPVSMETTEGYVLAQPSEAGSDIALVSPEGRVMTTSSIPPEVDEENSEAQSDEPVWTTTEVSTIDAAQPTAPIVYQGCVFALSTEPIRFTRTCQGKEDLRQDLPNLDRTAVRLKLVNGWVWVNDLDSGKLLVVGVEGDADRLDDWGVAVGESDEPDDGDSNTGKNEVDLNTDPIYVEDQPEVDEDKENQPPIAKDDAVTTRVDTPIIVPVLANDTDADGDIVLVTDVSRVPQQLQVAPTPDRTKIQVIPPAGARDTFEFNYTITDGGVLPDGNVSSASARVTVNVIGEDDGNTAPVTEPDRVEVSGGSTVSVNVLSNDVDPENDAMVLESVERKDGQVTFDPSGQVTYSPNPRETKGERTLAYSMRDSLGAASKGTIEVILRPVDTNNKPSAEDDSRAAVVGRPLAFNPLANDSDPDFDPLSVVAQPGLIRGAKGGVDQVSMSPDGEFFFAAEKAGSYVFSYTVSDNRAEDQARIRVDVLPAGENHRPVAVRDDVTISRGSSRIVYVLQNDDDEDADVLAIDGWTAADGVRVEETLGSGLNIKLAADAPDLVKLNYTVTDGRSDPAPGVVVIAASDRKAVDQPPVLKPDVLDVRAGRTGTARVLLNDYDPEGGAMAVVRTAPTEKADVRIGPGGQDIYVSPKAKVNTSFSFGYDVVDAAGNRVSSNVLVRPLPKQQDNRPPIARPDSARSRAGTRTIINAVRNDNDPDGDAIRIESIVAQPLFGDVAVTDDGNLRYRANPDARGSDRIEYLLIDAEGAKAIGVVLVGVMPADGKNRPPTAQDDRYNLVAGGDPLELGILDNDFDANGDPFEVTRVNGGGDAVTFDQAAGTVTFAPPSSVDGDERKYTFEYELADGRGGSDVATVTITVANAPQPISPVAVPDIVGPVLEDETVTYDVLANDIDVDGRRAELEVSSKDPDLAVGVDGQVTIEAGKESAEYLYTITDGDGLESQSVVTVIVTPNRPPQIESILVETKNEKPINIDIDDYVSDPDGDDLQFTCCQNLRRGRTEKLDDGRGSLEVKFTPDDRFDGEAGFAFQVTDGNEHQVAGTAVIRVLPPENRPPVIKPKQAEVDVEAGTTAPIDLSQWTTDPDIRTGDELSFEVTDDGGAPLTIGKRAIVRVSPPLDADGDQYTIGYRAVDQRNETAEGTVVVTVTESQIPPPVLQDDLASTIDTETAVVGVLDNDQGRELTVVAANMTSGPGSAAISGNGTAVAFTPEVGGDGQAVVAYTVRDVAEREATAQLVVTIIAPPGAPPAPSATAENATAAVQWGAPENGGSNITDYELRFEGGQGQSMGLATSHVYTNLDNGRPYRFQVRARNEAGWGEWSAFSVSVTPDIEPGQPAAPNVEFGDAQLQVAWSPPVNEGSPISGYELRISGGLNMTQPLGSGTAYTWTDLQNGTEYQFSVRAINQKGPSLWSAPSQSEHPLRQPGSPPQPAVTVGDRQLAIAWGDGDTGGDPISRYTVEMQGGGTVDVSGGQSYTWPNLQNGRFYQFRVRAYNRDPDPGDPSAWSESTKPCGKPDAPASPTAVRGDKQANVTYQQPNDQGCDISGYSIQVEGGGVQYNGGTAHTYTGLTNGQSYRFRVLATNNQGDGAYSGWSNAVTPAGPPFAPASTSASPTDVRTNTVTWSAADGNGDPISYYEVSVNGGPPVNVGNVTQWNHTGENGATYTYLVNACNTVGCGPDGPQGQATMWDVPAQAAAPTVTGSDRSMTATWSEPANGGTPVNGYQVTRSGESTQSHQGTSKSWSGLSYGTSYTVTVAACNAVGCGATSPSSNSYTPRAAPSQPATPRVEASGQDVKVSWNAPSDNGSPITGYTIDSPEGGRKQVGGGVRSVTYNAGYSQQICATVTATNGVGSSPASGQACDTTGPAPPPPRQVVASKGAPCGGPGPPCPSPGSCNANCNFVNINATGFAANASVNYQCYLNGGAFGSGGSRTTNGAGAYSGDLGCYNGFPGQVHVVFGGERSNTVNW